MSTEARASPSGGRDSVESFPTQPYPPHFYPPPNYQGGPQPQWMPGQLPPGVSGPWPPPPPWGYPGPPPGWSPTASGGKLSPHSSTVPMPSDEYTVDTMRRIYNDDDGRIEIQRVKVQRRPPEGPAIMFPPGSDSKSLVPVGSTVLNERRPPPRKNKMKKQMELMKSLHGQQGPYPWYPYMPCMPYPYTHPYYYGGACMWPGGIPPPPMTPWAGSDDSERTTSRQESLPATIDSQRLESRVSVTSQNSHSPVFARSPSPAATTHSITPSDSISVRGYKAEDSLSFSIRGPTPPPRKGRGSTDRKLRAIMAPSDDISEVGDKSSIITTSTDLVPYQRPPRRKRKNKLAGISDVSYLDQKDTDSLSDRSSITSEITCDDSSRLNSELSYAFRKFEQSVDVFKTKVSVESTPVNTPPRSPSPIILHSNDTAVTTKDDIQIPQSEDTIGEDTDTYITNTADNLQDKQPSATSISSLPPLETVSSDSVSISAPKKEETAQEFRDSKQEESSQHVPTTISEVNASASLQATDGIPITVEASDTTIKSTADISNKPVSQVLQETVTSIEPSAVTSSVSNTSPGDTTISLVISSAENSQPHIAATEMPGKDSKLPVAGKLEVTEAELDASSGRDSRLSSSTFFSIRPSDDPLHIDTDSTDILLPTTDATTADEGGEGTDWTAGSPVAEDTESYQWVLQQPGEIPDLTCSTADREDERRNAWRAEVSLWRARLVVSLCRGRGLDRQDWATFHLLVHHPLSLDLKLSMLHAPRLCVTNSTIGAALVRVALIHLAQYGETLLQPEASRQLGWRSIKVDPNQSWAPVKGAVEILKALGYLEREDGVLRYPRRPKTEVSVLARLTLDMLVLAEELRLYLTGTHQYPTNISDLFFPSTMGSTLPSEGSQIAQDLQRPPSSTGSYSYMSAQSSTSLNHRPNSQASYVTDEETETLQVSVKQAKSKKTRQPSSSDDEITLKEDFVNKSETKNEGNKDNLVTNEKVEEKSSKDDTSIENKNTNAPVKAELANMPSLLEQSTTSLDMSSLPDLQSIRSSTISLIPPSANESDQNTSVTPTATPIPDTSKGTEETKDNPEEHIYEEIDVIRQQVQALRASSVPVDTPPPLPPKKKVSSGGEDDSGLSLTYPHMEWTSASMPGSLRGGSTGARRKKRRAPMPPDFMPPDWKPYENRPNEDEQGKVDKSEDDKKRSLNPFYEDIDSVKSQVKELNKDYENKRKGRQHKGVNNGNPFEKDDYTVSGYVGKNPFYEDIEEEGTEKPKMVSRSAASTPLNTPGLCPMGSLLELQDESILLKAKRKAPRPPSTDPSSRTATPQPLKSTSPQPPKPPPPNVPPPRPPSSPPPPRPPSSPPPPRPPSSPPPPRPPSSPIPKHPPNIPPPKSPLTQEQLGTKADASLTTDSAKDNKSEESKKDKEKLKAKTIVGNAIKASLQKLQIQHPTIPPPPPPPKLDDEEEESLLSLEDHARNKSPVQQTPSALDDIPYMDANETNAEKVVKKTEAVSQYEIPELPGKDGIPPAPPLSPTTLRQTALLLRGHRSVPFIDESDLPPDCPPPPPPTSPPESPTETPKASPQETPHVSPPKTPNNSQPGTPSGSPPSSPITVKQEVTQPVTETSKDSPLNDENIEILKITVLTRDPSKEERSSIIENSQIDVLTDEKNTKENETESKSVSTPSKLTPDAAQEETASKIPEDSSEPPPLPPKTGTSLISNEDPYANQSVTSSRSAEKHELPEKPKQADICSEVAEDTTGKLDKEEEEEEEEEENQKDEETSKPPQQEEVSSEEDYEIPEVVRETALSIGPEGMPIRVGGPAHSHRMDLESVFGPPKPPKRRNRNSSLPPPRPPKSMILEGTGGLPKLPPKGATITSTSSSSTRPASASTTASFVTASAGSPTPAETPTSFQGTPRPTLTKQRSKTRRSWPLLFCDCMYANCKNYDEINK